jgi:hypothetical protein
MCDRSNDIETAMPDTGIWLLEHMTYRRWLSQHQGLLWIKGKPGAGKSTLMKHALTSMTESHSAGQPATLSFFFHGRGTSIQQSPLGLYRALLHQLLQRFPEHLSDVVRSFQERYSTKGDPGVQWNWHENELQGWLNTAIAKILHDNELRIVIDALDEAGEKAANGLVTWFRRLLRQPQDSFGLSIIFSCRHYPIISCDGGSIICVEDENFNDIQTYIRAKFCDELPNLKQEEANSLEDKILSKACGAFQWVVLVLERAITDYRRRKPMSMILSLIDMLPQELHRLYETILEELNNDKADRGQSLQLFLWICCSIEPLSIRELVDAMMVSHDIRYRSLRECEKSYGFVNGLEEMETRVKCLSGGLAEVVYHSHKESVQFVHQSVSDYLMDNDLHALSRFDNTGDLSEPSVHQRLCKY